MQINTMEAIEILGTISFAISGSFAAMQKRLDPFGVLIIAFVTSVGGGTVRDLLLGDTPVAWMRDVNFCLLILLTSILSFLKPTSRNLKSHFFFLIHWALAYLPCWGYRRELCLVLVPEFVSHWVPSPDASEGLSEIHY